MILAYSISCCQHFFTGSGGAVRHEHRFFHPALPGAAHVPRYDGLLRGHRFAVRQYGHRGGISLLAEAAEELTFAADTTDDFELEERKERDEINEAMEERIKKYQEMMRGAREVQKTKELKGFLDSRTEKEEALRQLIPYLKGEIQ